jgi:ADP-ribose pyrophosphatase YjhB (NUDIX family)
LVPCWFDFANEELVDAVVQELHEESGLIPTPNDLTLLSDAPVRVAIPKGHKLVYVYSAYVLVPYVMTHLRTPAQLEQVVASQSTTNHDGSYVVLATIDIDGQSLMPVKQGLLPVLKRKNDYFTLVS